MGRDLPMLDRVLVAVPCSEDWDAMRGDGRVRFCGVCEKNVFDLAAMSAAEAEALLASRGVRPCVRLYQRVDGTVVTGTCTDLKRRAARELRCAGTAAIALALLACGAEDAPVPRAGYGAEVTNVGKSNADLGVAVDAEPEPVHAASSSSAPGKPAKPKPLTKTMGVMF